ncbi:MAG TPA: hypothetical protein VF549_09700 [Solirubrobacteraceae bacterium]
MSRPLVATLVVAALGFAFVGQGFTNPGSHCNDDKADAYWLEDASPPGAVRCQGHRRSGAHYEWVILPWIDWATVLVVAASAGVLVAAVRGRRIRLVGAARLLFWSAVFAWFLESTAISWALAAVAAAALVEVSRSAALR